LTELSSDSRALIDRFGEEPGVTQDQISNLQKVLHDSPVLIEQLNAAVAQGCLRRIEPLNNAHAGGEYHAADKAMCLPLNSLRGKPRQKPTRTARRCSSSSDDMDASRQGCR